MSTSRDGRVRDAETAVELAEEFLKPESGDMVHQDTLAAAYAEAGRFDDAIRLQESLLAQMDQDDARYADYRERLEGYREHKPWRSGEK